MVYMAGTLRNTTSGQPDLIIMAKIYCSLIMYKALLFKTIAIYPSIYTHTYTDIQAHVFVHMYVSI